MSNQLAEAEELIVNSEAVVAVAALPVIFKEDVPLVLPNKISICLLKAIKFLVLISSTFGVVKGVEDVQVLVLVPYFKVVGV